MCGGIVAENQKKILFAILKNNFTFALVQKRI